MIYHWQALCALYYLFLLTSGVISEWNNGEDLTPVEPSLIIPGRNVSKLLENVLKQYDRRIRPYYGVKKLDVKLDMLILALGEVSESNMDFTLDMYLGQFWLEPRLAFGLQNRTISLGGKAAERFWLPDTFFVNAIDTKIHHMLFTNKKIWVNLTNGFVMLSARLKTRNSCKLDLRKFPFDTQICHLPFESYSYEETELKYEWYSPLESDIRIYDAEMAQFTIVSAKRYLKHKVYHSSMFSGLTATIKFQRRSTYYIFQMYIPCVLIVALSWVGFWIDHESVPARVALSITTVLTISYMRGSVNENMPKVSYLKSIDYFLLGSFSFIFMTLIEYVLVLKLARKKKHGASRSHRSQEEEEWEKKKMTVNLKIGEKSYYFKTSTGVMSELENGNGPLGHNNSFKTNINIAQPATGNQTVHLLSKEENKDVDIKRKNGHTPRLTLCQYMNKKMGFGDPGVTYIDMYSRRLFPLGYVSFLVVYFIIYLV